MNLFFFKRLYMFNTREPNPTTNAAKISFRGHEARFFFKALSSLTKWREQA